MKTSSGKTYEEQPDGSFIEVDPDYERHCAERVEKLKAYFTNDWATGKKVGGIFDEQA